MRVSRLFVIYRKRLALQAAFFLFTGALTASAQEDLASESHKAKELMADHRFLEAIPIYEKLVKALPGNPGLLLDLGLAEEMGGRPAQAIPHFEAVLKAQPDSIPALVSLSMARLQLNQTREAIPPLRVLIKLRPKDRNALGMLAEAEMGQQLFSEAAGHYRELIDQDNTDARAWYGLGNAYESLATHTFDHLNKSAPQSAYIAILLAGTRLQRRQYRSAFFFYHEAESKLPEFPGIHAGLAMVYRNTEHADWAAAEEKREQTLPAPNCKTQAVECAFLAGQFLKTVKAISASASPTTLFWATKAYNQLAAQSFDRLSQLTESVQIHQLKAQTLHDHKQDLEAANEWRAALKLAPGDDKIKRELAAALFEAKDYQSAIPLLEEQLALDPKALELNYLMGASLFRTEQPEKALTFLEQAVAGHAVILQAEAALGSTLVALNRSVEAISHLKKALALDDDGGLHYSLGRAYAAAGETKLAAETMQQYQHIQKQNREVNEQLAKEAEITAPAKF